MQCQRSFFSTSSHHLRTWPRHKVCLLVYKEWKMAQSAAFLVITAAAPEIHTVTGLRIMYKAENRYLPNILQIRGTLQRGTMTSHTATRCRGRWRRSPRSTCWWHTQPRWAALLPPSTHCRKSEEMWGKTNSSSSSLVSDEGDKLTVRWQSRSLQMVDWWMSGWEWGQMATVTVEGVKEVNSCLYCSNSHCYVFHYKCGCILLHCV